MTQAAQTNAKLPKPEFDRFYKHAELTQLLALEKSARAEVEASLGALQDDLAAEKVKTEKYEALCAERGLTFVRLFSPPVGAWENSFIDSSGTHTRRGSKLRTLGYK